jgi:hypothetical protein
LTDDETTAINSVNQDDLLNKFLDFQQSHFDAIEKTNKANYDTNIGGWTNRINNLRPQ